MQRFELIWLESPAKASGKAVRDPIRISDWSWKPVCIEQKPRLTSSEYNSHSRAGYYFQLCTLKSYTASASILHTYKPRLLPREWWYSNRIRTNFAPLWKEKSLEITINRKYHMTILNIRMQQNIIARVIWVGPRQHACQLPAKTFTSQRVRAVGLLAWLWMIT
jgi:hypothetical protein